MSSQAKLTQYYPPNSEKSLVKASRSTSKKREATTEVPPSPSRHKRRKLKENATPSVIDLTSSGSDDVAIGESSHLDDDLKEKVTPSKKKKSKAIRKLNENEKDTRTPRPRPNLVTSSRSSLPTPPATTAPLQKQSSNAHKVFSDSSPVPDLSLDAQKGASSSRQLPTPGPPVQSEKHARKSSKPSTPKKNRAPKSPFSSPQRSGWVFSHMTKPLHSQETLENITGGSLSSHISVHDRERSLQAQPSFDLPGEMNIPNIDGDIEDDVSAVLSTPTKSKTRHVDSSQTQSLQAPDALQEKEDVVVPTSQSQFEVDLPLPHPGQHPFHFDFARFSALAGQDLGMEPSARSVQMSPPRVLVPSTPSSKHSETSSVYTDPEKPMTTPRRKPRSQEIVDETPQRPSIRRRKGFSGAPGSSPMKGLLDPLLDTMKPDSPGRIHSLLDQLERSGVRSPSFDEDEDDTLAPPTSSATIHVSPRRIRVDGDSREAIVSSLVSKNAYREEHAASQDSITAPESPVPSQHLILHSTHQSPTRKVISSPTSKSTMNTPHKHPIIEALHMKDADRALHSATQDSMTEPESQDPDIHLYPPLPKPNYTRLSNTTRKADAPERQAREEDDEETIVPIPTPADDDDDDAASDISDTPLSIPKDYPMDSQIQTQDDVYPHAESMDSVVKEFLSTFSADSQPQTI
ncbi:hypothetical protein ABKN59_000315 [Abortiporus biennis]